jgi:glycosyltransferase involved in cell wall biosynthesis
MTGSAATPTTPFTPAELPDRPGIRVLPSPPGTAVPSPGAPWTLEAAWEASADQGAGRAVGRGDAVGLASVDVVIPVYNEEAQLASSILKLQAYLADQLPIPWRVVIADNASTDGTWEIAHALSESLPGVTALHLDQKGRGLALRTAWLASEAKVVSYMDVDLSTNLRCFLPLLAPLLSGHSELAIGSRLLPGSRIRRQPRREILSRGYNVLVHLAFRTRFSDAQCGFKAMTRSAAQRLLPLVRDESWFFDTELLLLAERLGYRIFEVPVDWIEDLDSRVDIPRTAMGDLRGLWRVRRQSWAHPLTPPEEET